MVPFSIIFVGEFCVTIYRFNSETNFNNHFNSTIIFITHLSSGSGYESW